MAIELQIYFLGFAPSSTSEMESHEWPEKVRELWNFSQKLTAQSISKGNQI